MSPRLDDIERLIALIDRVVFAQPSQRDAALSPEPQGATLALVSYLNEMFPQVALPAGRRARIQRKLMRAMGIPAEPNPAPWGRLEDEMNRRLRAIDPRWRPVMGGAAIVLLGVLGIAYWRQRSGERGIAAFAR
jgi:hypothetical protein